MAGYAAKILIIDDCVEIVNTLTALLQQHDYAVVTALNGKDALNRAEQEKPDLILLDIAIPEVDGFVIGSRLRQDEATKHIPIIMLTAHAEYDDKARAAKDIGPVEFIPKPFRFDFLLEKIGQALKGKGDGSV